MDATFKKVTIVPFDGDEQHYPTWAKQMTSRLALEGLSGAIGSPPSRDAAIRTKAYHIIYLSITEKAMLGLPSSSFDGTESNILWDNLKGRYAPDDPYSLQALRRDLDEIKYSSSLEDFICQCEKIRRRAQATGSDKAISDEDIKFHACHVLPSQFFPVTAPFIQKQVPDASNTWIHLCKMLRGFSKATGVGEKRSSSALYASSPMPVSPNTTSASSISPMSSPEKQRSSAVVCFYCRKPGHRKNECRKLKWARRRANEANLGKSTEDTVIANQAIVLSAIMTPTSRLDYDDEDDDHVNFILDGMANPISTTASSDLMPVMKCDLPSQSQVLSPPNANTSIVMLAESSTLPLTEQSPGSLEFYFDTCATRHICAQRDLFSDLSPSNTTIKVASGKVIVAAGQGSVPLRVHDHRGNPVEILLKDVLFLPDGNHNLLSYPVLRQHGHRYRERDDDAEIRLSTGIRLPLDRRFDGIDYLRCVSNNMENIATTATAMMIHNDPGIERIHMRMGHLNLQALKDLGLIDVVDPEFFCHTCALSKSARHSISKKADARQLPPGKLIHTDFAGPFEVPTSSGMKYGIVFIDDRTRYNFVYLMKSPKECLLKFRLVIPDFAELNVAIGCSSIRFRQSHNNPSPRQHIRCMYLHPLLNPISIWYRIASL